MNSLRIAHISDPHFASLSFNFNQFFSKRWLGNCNLLLFRSKLHRTDELIQLPKLFSSLQVDLVAITGDLTTTSLDKEYIKAKAFVSSFTDYGLMTVLLPGNHDIYTKGSARAKRFYQYFPSAAAEGKIEVKKIKESFWWIGLDCAYASNLFLSDGKFTAEMKKALEKILVKIPSSDSVIMGNHFPLFSSGNRRHDLQGTQELQKLLQRFPQVRLYLHGHDHVHYIVDKRKEGLPLTFNAGSISHWPERGFYLIDLTEKECHWQRHNL